MEVNEDENLAVEALGQLGNCCRTWTCEFCDVLFFSEPEYNDHLQSHGEKENVEYQCAKCNETFKIKIALDAHELSHLTAEKLEYQCDICLMWFQRLSSLRNHEKVHMPNSLKDSINKNKQKKPGKRGRKSKKNSNKEPPSPAFELIASSAYSSKENSDEDTNDNEDCFEVEEDKPKDVNNINITHNGTSESQPIVEDSKPHACLFCAKKFAREKALLSHMRLHDDNFEAVFLTCTKCEISFDDLPSLQSHVATCMSIKSEPAQIDSDGSEDYFNPFVDKPNTKKYMNIHPAKKLKRDFANDYDRSTLFRVSQGKYACDQCTKSFKTRQKLFRHVWIHRTKAHKCEKCGASFYTAGKLEDHTNMFHSADAPFVCVECGKGYTTQKSLTDHKHYHLIKAKELCCPYCMKIFSSRQGFIIHQRIHTGERPYICEYCTKPFRDGATLRKHELIHTGERPFKCPICKSAFNQKVVLREHIRGVHVGKSKHNICEVCKEVKTDSESLSEHLVKHSDEIRGPVIPRKRNPFIIRWSDPDAVTRNKKPTVVVSKKVVLKRGRPRLLTTSDRPNKKKSPAQKKKKNVTLKRQRNSKVVKHLPVPVRKSTRERKTNQGFSNYIQEDLDLLLELAKEEEVKTTKRKSVSNNEDKSVTPRNRPGRKKKSATVKPKVSAEKPAPVTKRKRGPNKTKNVESTSSYNGAVDSNKEVKNRITAESRSNQVEYPPVLNFTEVCAMCNEKFTSREDLLIHVTVHI